MGRAYYNEIDPYAAEWIRNLIKAGHITDGEVDTRSIVDVHPADLRGFTRCHFFAGIAVWDYALGLAGWPEDREVWTGSCPCQPFSAAGKRGGTADERHLWPAFFHLIRECRPATVLGEQVASKDGLGWLDLVCSDLEGEGYAVGAADLCAAGVGAPHIRQRLWFVAHSGRERRAEQPVRLRAEETGRLSADLSEALRRGGSGGVGGQRADAGNVVVLGHSSGQGGRRHAGAVPGAQGEGAGERGGVGREPDESVASGATGHWHAADWIPCRDGKARPVEPGTFPLAHGASSRVGRLRAYGNAIVAPVAATFISAVLDLEPTEAAAPEDPPKIPKRVARIIERCERGQILCRGQRPEAWWFEPSGIACGSSSARKAVDLGLLTPISGDLLGDGTAQTYGVV